MKNIVKVILPVLLFNSVQKSVAFDRAPAGIVLAAVVAGCALWSWLTDDSEERRAAERMRFRRVLEEAKAECDSTIAMKDAAVIKKYHREVLEYRDPDFRRHLRKNRKRSGDLSVISE